MNRITGVGKDGKYCVITSRGNESGMSYCAEVEVYLEFKELDSLITTLTNIREQIRMEQDEFINKIHECSIINEDTLTWRVE